jgi:hypothetical protein
MPSSIDQRIIADIRRKFLAMPDEQRVELLYEIGICRGCGADLIDPAKAPGVWNSRRTCHCQNDE